MGCSAMGQGNFDALPDCYKDLKPWIDDSTSGLVSVSNTEEWGGFGKYGGGYDLREIIRKPEENKVVIKDIYDDERYVWIYGEDRKIKSKSCAVIQEIGTVYRLLYIYDENEKLQSTIKIDAKTGVQDTIEKYENGKLAYKSGYIKTKIKDTTVFSRESLTDNNYSFGGGMMIEKIVEKYDADGNLLLSQSVSDFSDGNAINLRRYEYNEQGLVLEEEIKEDVKTPDGNYYSHYGHTKTYNEAGLLSTKKRIAWDYETEKMENEYLITYKYDSKKLLVREEEKKWNKETGKFDEPETITIYEYDSKNQLIRKDVYDYYCNGSRVYEYAYDHKGNLTLKFDSYDYFYWGEYTNYEYEGGKKKYAPFDPAMYPTDKYPANSPVAKHGKLQVSGKNMVDVNGNIVQLRGISTHGIAWFTECYSESSVDALVDDWGINVLRIASYAENQIKEENGKDAEWHRTFIDSMVNLCERKGIYCIIDWHTLDDGTGDPWTVMDEAKEFFEYMSKKHAGKAHVMYEICNEPNYSGIFNLMDCNGEPSKRMESFVSWARVKQYAQEIIDVIVKNDPSSIIIVGTPVWCQRVFAAANSPLDYPNAMYSLHFYSAASSHKDVLRANGDSAIAKNLPIFVSEFGTCGSGGSGSLDVPETIKWFKWMNDNNLSWVNWNFADKAESSCLLKPNSCEEQNWDNYTESGRIIKWALSDPELNGADSVLLVDAALKKNRYLRRKDIRFDYLGSCIAENPSFVTDNDIDGLVHCAYIKECLAEEPELAKDEARLDSCAKDKATDVALTNSSLHGVSVYPNPVKDNLVVDYDGSEFSVVLIDLLGSEVLREECVQGKNVVNVSSLAPGCYLVKVESNGKFHFEKMSKE